MNKQHFLKALGPGLIFAGASVGVSHLVQATRAGADYGFTLLGWVILAHVIKFPFFEYGPRYVTATGEHLLKGYRRMGWGPFGIFVGLSLGTMFIIQGAVTLVTAGLLTHVLGGGAPMSVVAAILLGGCWFILTRGHYALLDRSMKGMIVLLSAVTVVAVAAAVGHARRSSGIPTSSPVVWNLGALSFLLALMGWMPAPIDISVWHSFWSAERRRQTGYRPTLGESLLDFHLGYWGTAVLAVLFLSLGALVMHGSAEGFAASAVAFTGQVIALYTRTLGGWSYPVIVTAAFITMFSTTLSCLDAFSRVVEEAWAILRPADEGRREEIYNGWMTVLAVGTWLVITRFLGSLKALVDFATILSFLAAPVLAYLNLRAVTGPFMPVEARPSGRLQIFSWMGIAFLSVFSVVFLLWRFGWSA